MFLYNLIGLPNQTFSQITEKIGMQVWSCIFLNSSHRSLNLENSDPIHYHLYFSKRHACILVSFNFSQSNRRISHHQQMQVLMPSQQLDQSLRWHTGWITSSHVIKIVGNICLINSNLFNNCHRLPSDIVVVRAIKVMGPIWPRCWMMTFSKF